MSHSCFVGLGANLGDACASVLAALDALDSAPGTKIVRASSLYRTRAWGKVDQPDFINAVARLETSLPPLELLGALLAIERAAGRDRSSASRWGPRTLDLDLLLYGEQVIEVPGLRVPHPHLHERAFALVPLLEIAPEVVIPGIGPGCDALARMATTEVEALTYAASSAWGPAAKVG
ncbi:MAG: 2-amino-4-hydroxy-6-hydroxymethyldihydropteridinepyrophosphokinase [uncultured Lysobacter sp.]|uniref:2-amino-4-hydroxy-6-hydroxymethyldihydropteridine pyrophosphokinase n=1 Tax=uncultured Lysobacter sp. TaxID=271060 RepID=A0A6J4LEV6_9GAMM|nr:MAG: 2-amino-4-hydroxy-6-hydroxymethyldihydropteridinepyrophosphokinase [uncultured Lysobacter sp.]